MMTTKRTFVHQILGAVFLLLLLPTLSLHAQRGKPKLSVSPPEIYSGENTITIKLKSGIKEIRTSHSDRVSVEGEGEIGCNTEHELQLFVNTASESVDFTITVIDCKGRIYTERLTNKVWTLDQIDLGEVVVGETICRDFQIRAGGTEYLDDVTIADPRVTINLPRSLPARIPDGGLFIYQVCFTADAPGEYTFPSVTWMRRQYPSGGKTTYAVADTGVIRVIPPPDTVVIDTIRVDTIKVDTAQIIDMPEIEEDPTDPTTFRSVAVPNAIIPRKGTLYLGSYDLLGLTAGYAFDDHMMVIAGGALPLPDDWGGIRGEMFGAYSIGVKIGLPIDERLNIAAGYQYATSIYDKQETSTEVNPLLPDIPDSKITLHVPYVAISYGDDDSRLSLTAAYALKHHATLFEGEFDRNAAVVAVGGDYRIGGRWKLAAEVVAMQTLDVIPIVGTVRYFGDRYAFDFGLGFVGITTGDAKAPAIPLVPVLSGVFVF